MSYAFCHLDNLQKRKHEETDDDDDKEVAMIFSQFKPPVQDFKLDDIGSVRHPISKLNLSEEEIATDNTDCINLNLFDENINSVTMIRRVR